MNRIWTALWLGGVACAIAACGSDNDTTAAATANEGGGGGVAGAGGGGGQGAKCPLVSPPALNTSGDDSVCLGTVTGKVLDQDGNPPATTTITVCGDACIFGDISSDGTFSIAVNHCYKKSAFFSVPVMIYHGWPDYADITVKVVPDGETNVPNADAGTLTTVATAGMKKYPYVATDGATFTDDHGFSIEAAACTLALPAFQNDVYLAAVALEHFPIGDAPSDVLGLYYVAPDNSFFTTPTTVRFPNTTKLAAGTAVELMALGNMGTTTVIEAGTFGVVGSGRVSADGAFVESVPGTDSGLITLGWLGYRVAP